MGFITDYSSFKKLQNLAKKPFDLNKPNAVSEKRVKKYVLKAGDFKLLYALEKINDKIIEALFELANESNALEMMQAQQNGEAVNVFENRAVLHTSMRDVFEDSNSSDKAKKAAVLEKKELEKCRNFLKQIDGEFEYLVHIGIGGSHLGVEVVFDALKNLAKPKIKPFFINNIDPDKMYQVLQEINLKKTLFVVVSKSGSTLETKISEQFFRKALEKAKIDSRNRFLAITTAKSQMDKAKNYRKIFYFWDYIGGRYSVTSMVGAVSLSLLIGNDLFVEFLKGAHQMDLIALKKTKDNLPLILALLGIWKRNFLKLPTLAVVPYCSALKKFCFYLQQLDMESNGKSVSLQKETLNFSTAPFLFGDSGSNAQHSFFQLLHQGTDISAQEFIGFKKPQIEEKFKIDKTTVQQKLYCNLFGSALALALGEKNQDLNKNFFGNRPTSILLADQLTAKTMGQLIALYEHKIAFQGYIWGIDSFDQEGVQLGKNISNKFLKTLEGEPNLLHKAFLELMS